MLPLPLTGETQCAKEEKTSMFCGDKGLKRLRDAARIYQWLNAPF